ncbi:MAG TPA: enolase C-terminal domain-like protein [Burkholderiales bacterium]|nr:enolase C-terminal domain-like protein [Burkholderiales bacterium]
MKIRHIEALAVSLPMVKPLKMSFEEVRSGENVLVRLEVDDGTVGWGGAASAPTMTGETVASMAAAIRYLAPRLEGMPLADIGAAMGRANSYLYGNESAKSVIEIALHDALGRATRKPVHDLLGPKRRERIPILCMVGTGKGIAADVEEAMRTRAEGHVAFKIKVGVADPRDDAERTRKICDALDGNRDILICADANQGWTPEQAISYVQAVADTRLAFFEQPVAWNDLEGMARVAGASRIKVGCDEGLHSLDDIRRHHEAGAAGGFSLKTIKLGGIRPVYDAALLCEKLGLKVNLASKVAETGISTAAILQLAAAVPAVEWGVGFSSQHLIDDILKTPHVFSGGHIDVPTGPGLGIEVDEAKLRRYSREA